MLLLKSWILFSCVFPAVLVSNDLSTTTHRQNEILRMRQERVHVTTSVLVPCVPKHLQYMEDLLTAYTQQTVLPDEIVISLAEVQKTDPNELGKIKAFPWPFKLHIIEHDRKVSEGENRNIGSDYSSGDVLLFQDADDLPHPQRIEIIKYLFENFYVQHIYHGYIDELTNPNEKFEAYDLMRLDAFYAYQHVYQVGKRALHNGSVCFSRDIANQYRWVEGFRISTDSEFNQKIYKNVHDKVILVNPLVLYRHNYSTYHGTNKD